MVAGEWIGDTKLALILDEYNSMQNEMGERNESSVGLKGINTY